MKHAGWADADTNDLFDLLDPFSPHELLCLDGELHNYLSRHREGEDINIPYDMELLTTIWNILEAWRLRKRNQ